MNSKIERKIIISKHNIYIILGMVKIKVFHSVHYCYYCGGRGQLQNAYTSQTVYKINLSVNDRLNMLKSYFMRLCQLYELDWHVTLTLYNITHVACHDKSEWTNEKESIDHQWDYMSMRCFLK